jgi:putative addiction module killer protein
LWKPLQEYCARNQTALSKEPFSQWLRSLRDAKGRAVIRTRLNRIQDGNFSNCEPVGEGVHELKIDFGPGYRVYFGEDANLVILLLGGDKSSQDRDVRAAKEYWRDYNA